MISKVPEVQVSKRYYDSENQQESSDWIEGEKDRNDI